MILDWVVPPRALHLPTPEMLRANERDVDRAEWWWRYWSEFVRPRRG